MPAIMMFQKKLEKKNKPYSNFLEKYIISKSSYKPNKQKKIKNSNHWTHNGKWNTVQCATNTNKESNWSKSKSNSQAVVSNKNKTN
jgi:hypothetical protein